jgi:hypothetical protein
VKNLSQDDRGAIMVEYVILVGTAGIPLMSALVYFGVRLILAYVEIRDTIASPFP